MISNQHHQSQLVELLVQQVRPGMCYVLFWVITNLERFGMTWCSIILLSNSYVYEVINSSRTVKKRYLKLQLQMAQILFIHLVTKIREHKLQIHVFRGKTFQLYRAELGLQKLLQQNESSDPTNGLNCFREKNSMVIKFIIKNVYQNTTSQCLSYELYNNNSSSNFNQIHMYFPLQ